MPERAAGAKRRVAAALVHYPVLDRQNEIVTAAITNIDLHDITRSAHTYGLSDVFVVHPIAAQRTLAERVRAHWVEGSGARRIPDRSPAMQILRIVETLEQAIGALGGRSSVDVWVTSASAHGRVLRHEVARELVAQAGNPVLLVFGTGWGLAEEVCRKADAQLEPIDSPRPDRYNHLSVRAAAAIIFDRLLGNR
jgi:hypothetical protein